MGGREGEEEEVRAGDEGSTESTLGAPLRGSADAGDESCFVLKSN